MMRTFTSLPGGVTHHVGNEQLWYRARIRALSVPGFPDPTSLDFFVFSHILGIIIPIDFHIFQRGFKPPTRIGFS